MSDWATATADEILDDIRSVLPQLYFKNYPSLVERQQLEAEAIERLTTVKKLPASLEAAAIEHAEMLTLKIDANRSGAPRG